ncbi:hypothetical protein Avbf_07986, partial [Armadillidium vulgare]
GTFRSTGNQELKRRTKEREPIYTIKTYTHPITNFTNLLTIEGRVSQRIRQSQGQSFTRKAEAITYQIQLILTSTFDHMRCTFYVYWKKLKI